MTIEEILALAVECGAEVPPVTGASGTVEVVVAGRGRVSVGMLDGRPVAAHAGPGSGDADVTLSLAEPELAAILAGASEPSVEYMRGRLKTVGDPGLVLAALAATAGPAFARWLGTVSGPQA